ncbi:transposase [Atopobium sp. oral taxon 416]|nr:transposase [Atopobium sp. oral taxon 416]
MQDVYGCPDRESTAKAPDRLCLWMMHSAVAKIKRMAGTFRQERKGILNWWRRDPPIRFSKGSTPPPSQQKALPAASEASPTTRR